MPVQRRQALNCAVVTESPLSLSYLHQTPSSLRKGAAAKQLLTRREQVMADGDAPCSGRYWQEKGKTIEEQQRHRQSAMRSGLTSLWFDGLRYANEQAYIRVYLRCLTHLSGRNKSVLSP